MRTLHSLDVIMETALIIILSVTRSRIVLMIPMNLYTATWTSVLRLKFISVDINALTL